jgi:hypothetical protein
MLAVSKRGIGLSFLDGLHPLGLYEYLSECITCVKWAVSGGGLREHPVNYFYAHAHRDGDRHRGDAQGANWD